MKLLLVFLNALYAAVCAYFIVNAIDNPVFMWIFPSIIMLGVFINSSIRLFKKR